MSNLVEFVDGDMTEEDRKKIDELLIKIAEENELHEEIGKLEEENTRLQRKLNESIDDNYKNAWKIQQQAERGAKFAQNENARLREALEVILDEAQKDEPCILAIKVVAYTALKGVIK